MDIVDDDLRPAYGDPRAVVVRWGVPPDAAGKTAPEVLAHKVRRLGIARALRVVRGGDFRVDGAVVDEHTCLARGTVVELWRLPPDAPDDLVHVPSVLFRGDGVVVVDKPGDLPVHPSARYLHNTLTAWLRREGMLAHPCHRLDRETSGVIVCAAEKDAERAWKRAFADGRVHKEYLAVVRGVVRAPFTVDRPLALQAERGLVRIRMIADDAGAAAVTDVEPLYVDEVHARTVVRARPRTGRQHQIRAHLAIAGYPIVGDKLYAMGDAWFDRFTRRALSDDDRAALDHPRQALHATRLTRASDDGSAPVSFSAPWPPDLRALVPSFVPPSV